MNWVLLKPPTTDPPTHRPTNHFPLTHQLTERSSLTCIKTEEQILQSLILQNFHYQLVHVITE